MAKLRVGVLRGGPSSEYEVSLKTGESVLGALSREKYLPLDILITKEGAWNMNGLPIASANLAQYADVALLALHGEYGEDGQVQRFLESISLPYTGSDHIGSAIGMSKHLSKDIVKKAGLKVPRSVLVMAQDNQEEKVREIISSFAPPYIVKPSDLGSSVGLFLVRSASELPKILTQAYEFSNTVLVEEYIKGKEATCGVVENYRGRDIYALMPVEIRPPQGKDLFDYDAKYSGESEEICPGNFTPAEKAELERLATLAHKALGLRHYSRSDFIVTPRGIYFLEVNTLPGLTTASLLPKSLAAVGFKYPDFLDHLIDLALDK